MSGLKAIETVYNGYRFRSRLEARWAVFFDALDIKWEYEKEGFELGEAGRYLPDFWLPEHRYWIEIKASHPPIEDLKKIQTFAWGMPDDEVYLFDIPDFRPPFMDFSKPQYLPDFAGAWGRLFSQYAEPDDFEGDCAQTWTQCTDCMLERRPVTFGVAYSKYMKNHAAQAHGVSKENKHAGIGCDDTRDLVQAYLAARQARFEFGQSGPKTPVRPTGGSIDWKLNASAEY